MVYKHKDVFIGVCLELDVSIFDPSADKALSRIIKITEETIKVVREDNMPEKILNQTSPIKYRLKWYYGCFIASFLNLKNYYVQRFPFAYGV